MCVHYNNCCSIFICVSCMCGVMHVHMTYICIYIYVHDIHVCMMYVCVHMNVCMHVYMNVHECVHMYTHIHVCMYICVHMNVLHVYMNVPQMSTTLHQSYNFSKTVVLASTCVPLISVSIAALYPLLQPQTTTHLPNIQHHRFVLKT